MKCPKCKTGTLTSVTVVKDVYGSLRCIACNARYVLEDKPNPHVSVGGGDGATHAGPMPHIDWDDARDMLVGVVSVLDNVTRAAFKSLKQLLQGR